MELRLLRYFVAVAEQCSLTNAAERRLHTAQPSLSRQIRDLELEIGVKLLERKARGMAISDVTSRFSWHNEGLCPGTPFDIALGRWRCRCNDASRFEKHLKWCSARAFIAAVPTSGGSR